MISFRNWSIIKFQWWVHLFYGIGDCLTVMLVFSVVNDLFMNVSLTLQWRYNGHDSVPNHQPHDCLLNRLFRHRSKKTSKRRVTGLCVGNSPVTGEFPTQRASNAETVSKYCGCQPDKPMGFLVTSKITLQYLQATGLDARASRVKWPAQFMSHWYGILFTE